MCWYAIKLLTHSLQIYASCLTTSHCIFSTCCLFFFLWLPVFSCRLTSFSAINIRSSAYSASKGRSSVFSAPSYIAWLYSQAAPPHLPSSELSLSPSYVLYHMLFQNVYKSITCQSSEVFPSATIELHKYVSHSIPLFSLVWSFLSQLCADFKINKTIHFFAHFKFSGVYMWYAYYLCYRHKCRTQKHTNSILKTNIQRMNCLQSCSLLLLKYPFDSCREFYTSVSSDVIIACY